MKPREARSGFAREMKKSEDFKDTPRRQTGLPVFSPNLIRQLADEVTKGLMQSVPMLHRPRKKKAAKQKKLEYPLFLDTSAIIDRRIFDVIDTGLLNGTVVVPQSILEELKSIADAQDAVKRERGRRGLEYLEQLRKSRKMKLIILQDDEEEGKKKKVDERLIAVTKRYKGKLITCDYNLEKEASIQNVKVINVNALANDLKVSAVPGEAVHMKVLHQGKESTQGVGYLDDGTMVVIEHGSDAVDKMIDVVVSRVIQTATGRILFAKKI